MFVLWQNLKQKMSEKRNIKLNVRLFFNLINIYLLKCLQIDTTAHKHLWIVVTHIRSWAFDRGSFIFICWIFCLIALELLPLSKNVTEWKRNYELQKLLSIVKIALTFFFVWFEVQHLVHSASLAFWRLITSYLLSQLVQL